MKNFDVKSIIFIFALTAIIVISYLPANAEEMDESTMDQMKATMNEMDEAMMKEWDSMMMMKEMDEMKTAMMQKEAMMEKDSLVSPRKQFESGVDLHEIMCKSGYEIVLKLQDWSPACVSPSSAERLIQMGWAANHDTKHNKMMRSLMNEMDKAMMKEWDSMMKVKEMMAQAAETSTSISEEMNEDEASMMKMGEFVGLAGHKGEGIAKIVQAEDGTSFLRFEDFTVTNGPDLFVYIAQDGDVHKGILLERLKGSTGNQNYELPENTDLEIYNTAVVYCKLFGVYFAEATLT